MYSTKCNFTESVSLYKTALSYLTKLISSIVLDGWCHLVEFTLCTNNKGQNLRRSRTIRLIHPLHAELLWQSIDGAAARPQYTTLSTSSIHTSSFCGSRTPVPSATSKKITVRKATMIVTRACIVSWIRSCAEGHSKTKYSEHQLSKCRNTIRGRSISLSARWRKLSTDESSRSMSAL